MRYKFYSLKTLMMLLFTSIILLIPVVARAKGNTFPAEDSIADVISWIALILVPIICIVVFLMIHILPEKIAVKRNHPQAAAIRTLCLLSLIFGGLLWPLAWIWAYSKPTLYKMAYGTDQGDQPEINTVQKPEKAPEKKGDS